jgi:hypothetical protein
MSIVLYVSFIKIGYTQNSDSISYYKIRNNYIEIFGDNNFSKEFIDVSDGLASIKLFQEAEDILVDLFKEDKYPLPLDSINPLKSEGDDKLNIYSESSVNNTKTIQTGKQPYDPISWRITSSGSYNRYQYLNEESNDTSLNITDSTTNISSISNEYYSGYFLLTSDWIPKSDFISKISPYFYISDYYGKLGSKIKLSFLNNHMVIKGEIQGKLPMNKQYRDSSSAIVTNIKTGLKSPSLIKNSISNSIDLQLDLNFSSTQNRNDRYIDISNRLYTIKPTIEWATEDYRKNSSLGFLYNYKDYNRYFSISEDSSEVIREDDRYNYGPFIEAGFWNEFISASVYWIFLWEHYLKRNDTIPSFHETSNRNSFFEIQSTVTPANNLEFYVIFNYDMIQERFPCYEIFLNDTNIIDSQLDTISYESKTHYFRVEPELFIYYRLGIGNSLKFLYERQTITLHSEPQYIDLLNGEKIDDDYFSYLIGISFFINFKKFSFETGFNYIKRTVIEKTEFSNGDSFELEPAISMTWSPLKWLSFSLDGQIGYLKYLESSNPETGTGISLGCRLNF